MLLVSHATLDCDRLPVFEGQSKVSTKIASCFLKGAVFTINKSEDGFASGSKDGSVILWDGDFKPITKIDLLNSVIGYKGEVVVFMLLACPVLNTEIYWSNIKPKKIF
jgi:hypothetical protein